MKSPADIAYSRSRGGNPQGLPPLLLIHGAGGSKLNWPGEIRRMPEIDVFSMDLPGHGMSSGRGESSVEGYSSRVRIWMDELENDRWILAGHSMGGAIALTIALQEARRVAAVILVGSGARLRVHPDILELTQSAEGYQTAAGLVTQWSFSERADERLVELSEKQMRQAQPEVVHEDFQACDGFDVMDHLTGIQIPALIICGAEDRMTPVKYSQYLAEQIPNATLKVVEEAGHMVMLERPTIVAKAMGEFVQGLSIG
jgi:pimeloyl-ACP methyl ester carboxylesterase